MNFAPSLRMELAKTKRTAAFYLCLLMAVILPAIFLIDLLTDSGAPLRLQKDPWDIYTLKGFEILGTMFLPLFVILVCTLVLQLEYRNNTWKQVFASPQLLWHVTLSKLLVLHLLALFFLLTFNVLMYGVLLIAGAALPPLHLFTHRIDWSLFWRVNANSYLSIVGLLSIQFWLSLRIRNFIAPLGIGLGLLFAGTMLGFELQWQHANRFPHAFSMLVATGRHPEWEEGIRWWSLGYGGLFYFVALLDLRWRRPKS